MTTSLTTPTLDRLGALSSLIILGMILSFIVPLAGYELSFIVLGSEVALSLTSAAQFGVVVALLTVSGVDAVVRERWRPANARPSLARTAMFWPLPTATAVAGMVVAQSLTWWGYQVVMAAITTAATALIIVLQGRDEPAAADQAETWELTPVVLQMAVYVTAAVLLVALYSTRTRSLLSASGVALTTAGLTFERLRDLGAGSRLPLSGNTRLVARIWLYAALVGLGMGEFTWALNYYALPGAVGGGLLLLLFYLQSGLIRAHLTRGLSRSVVIEYAIVGILGLAILTGYARWLLP